MANPRTIGIIAGSGAYPETFARSAREKSPGIRLIGAMFRNETKPEFSEDVDVAEWFKVGQLTRPIRFFQEQGVEEAVMVGQIAPRNLFELRPDLRTLMVLARTRERNAESLFGGIADELGKEGIRLLPATTFMEDHMPGPGPVCGPPLKKRHLDDAEFGMRIAREISALDIGQSVVIRHGTVLAVEAFEGTDECIRRGGKLGRERESLVVKVSKPNQDLRFDVPVIGAHTVEVCSEAGVHGIVIEAGCTLMLEPARVYELCARLQISIHASP